MSRNLLCSSMTKLGIAALTRGVSSGPKRAKPIRIKKSEATRVVPTASTAPSNDALTEAPTPLPPASHLAHSSHEAPHTFGGMMKESFLWGMGMAVAFATVGIIFSSLEQSTSAHVFERSVVKAAEKEHEEGR